MLELKTMYTFLPSSKLLAATLFDACVHTNVIHRDFIHGRNMPWVHLCQRVKLTSPHQLSCNLRQGLVYVDCPLNVQRVLHQQPQSVTLAC